MGEGYYEPIRSIIYNYDDSILKTPSEAEVKIKHFGEKMNFIYIIGRKYIEDLQV